MHHATGIEIYHKFRSWKQNDIALKAKWYSIEKKNDFKKAFK